MGARFLFFFSAFLCFPSISFIPSTSTFLYLALSCCHNTLSTCVLLQEHACACVSMSMHVTRCCVHVWPLALLFHWAAYQTGCALGAEFVSRHRPCQLGGASNFLTQKLPPGRFPLSLPSFSSLTPHSSASPFSTHTPNPIDLSWRSKQAKCAVAAQKDQNQASKSCFTSLVDSIAMITAKISHSKQDNAEAVYEWQHKESVIQKRGLHGQGLWGLDAKWLSAEAGRVAGGH